MERIQEQQQLQLLFRGPPRRVFRGAPPIMSRSPRLSVPSAPSRPRRAAARLLPQHPLDPPHPISPSVLDAGAETTNALRHGLYRFVQITIVPHPWSRSGGPPPGYPPPPHSSIAPTSLGCMSSTEKESGSSLQPLNPSIATFTMQRFMLPAR